MDDLARELTLRGRRQAERIAAWLKKRLSPSTRILVSPSVRTRQTAQHLIEDFQIVAELAPGASPFIVLESAGWDRPATGCTVIVGHQPYLGEVVGTLLQCPTVHIGKGALWWLRRRENDGRISVRAVIEPKLV